MKSFIIAVLFLNPETGELYAPSGFAPKEFPGGMERCEEMKEIATDAFNAIGHPYIAYCSEDIDSFYENTDKAEKELLELVETF